MGRSVLTKDGAREPCEVQALARSCPEQGTRAYLKQVQRDRHGLQLPQQVHGSLLERGVPHEDAEVAVHAQP